MLESVYCADWPTQAKSSNEAFAALSYELDRLAYKAGELSLKAYSAYLSDVLAASHGNPRYYNPQQRNFGFFGEGKRLTRMCEEARARFMSVCADANAVAPAAHLTAMLEGGEFKNEADFEQAKEEAMEALRTTVRDHYDGGVQHGAHSF